MDPRARNTLSAAARRSRTAVVKTALLALGVSFEQLSRSCPEMIAEVSAWEEGRTLALGVLPRGPTIAVRKEGGGLRYLGWGAHGARLRILFKNVDGAFLTLAGFIGAHTAFAQHRAIVHGSVSEAMEANRAMAIVVKHLFPGFMLAKITKRTPRLSRGQLARKALLLAKLGPLLAANARK